MAILSYSGGMRERVLNIWLEGNLQAHPFLPASYWRGHREAVGLALQEAQVFVYEEEGELLGFLGLAEGNYIAGIFVAQGSRGRGVGARLLAELKSRYAVLRLHVYEKNERAVAFYRRQGFFETGREVEPDTGEREIAMEWRKV
ncbi:GNAT family N-acetyltransferase [Zongyangia hominis]|uniref:GNAT family N-acetyltransferase n=1 Tax=Zongyangia hominis TaxID=2763677 RepID=A0A926ED81_9FIRM|nr:GNAT family N-acetyltransferase [Zongyangia hominis]MBC8570923.1 GNAT family N-acetyltransferase [Zongyangia hominis]